MLRDTAITDRTRCPAPLDWSDDGQLLLVRVGTTLRIMALGGERPPVDIVRSGQVWEGHFATGARALAYSEDGTGRAEVYVQALPSGQPVRVSTEGGRWPRWTHGGRRLTWMTPDGRVQTADFAGGPTGGASVPRTLFSAHGWRRSLFDDLGAGFTVLGDGERYLVRQSPSGGAVTFVQNWPALMSRPASPR